MDVAGVKESRGWGALQLLDLRMEGLSGIENTAL